MEAIRIDSKEKHLKIPDGYELLKTGKCKEGDRFANNLTFKWSLAERDDIGMDVESFDYLIRPISGARQ